LYRLIGWQSFVGVAIMVISVSLFSSEGTYLELSVSVFVASHQHCHLEIPQKPAKGANGQQGRSNAIDERDSDQYQINQGM
jgi:hypothetical protein